MHCRLGLQETFGAMAKTEKIAYILEQVCVWQWHSLHNSPAGVGAGTTVNCIVCILWGPACEHMHEV
jgi:hypothetical protein